MNKTNNTQLKPCHGFTLIEVMVVVVILGILAATIIPRIMDRPDAARMTKARADLRAIESTLNLYKLDYFQYPDNSKGLQALVSPPGTSNNGTVIQAKPYLQQLPKDPWGKPYQYLNPGIHGEIDVFTLGADGQPGGEGVNADIGNWNIQ